MHGDARDGRLYLYTEGKIEAFSIEDGRRVWRRSLGVKRDWWGGTRQQRNIFMVDDRLSVGADDGCIYVLKAQNGRILERLDLYLHISEWPAILSGDLIIVDGLGLVAAYEPRFLDCRWWYPF